MEIVIDKIVTKRTKNSHVTCQLFVNIKRLFFHIYEVTFSGLSLFFKYFLNI